MYLVNVHSMQLEYFPDERDLEYVILSHRWQDDEVLFQDMESGNAPEKKGYAKLKRFCEEASAEKYTYVWCDTCCIDRKSSAELSESINSMFRWYQNAGLCFAYLYDLVTDIVHDRQDLESEWFTRGWCLQELIAPQSIVFYNTKWKRIGTRDDLSDIISQITGIRASAFGGNLEQFSAAQRMSWAADRKTTRSEDVAYCLLGILQVNIPLLYGEGGVRAFHRLQEEFIKYSNDQSIFVHESAGQNHQRLLAESPADFRNSSSIRLRRSYSGESYSLTNAGLSIHLRLIPWCLEVYAALLDCVDESNGQSIAIFVLTPPSKHKTNGLHLLRTKVDGRAWTHLPGVGWKIFKRLYIQDSPRISFPGRYGFWIRRFQGIHDWATKPKIWAVCMNKWSETDRVVELPPGKRGTVAIVICEAKRDDGTCVRQVVRLGFTADFEPRIEINGSPSVSPYGPDADTRINILSADAFSYTADGDPDPSISKGNVLEEDRYWSQPKSDQNQSESTILHCQGRNGMISFSGKSGTKFEYSLFCRKMRVDGIITWTVDIIWRECGRPVQKLLDMPARSTFKFDDMEQIKEPCRHPFCTVCGEKIYHVVYICPECVPSFRVCHLCVGDAKRIHTSKHVLESC